MFCLSQKQNSMSHFHFKKLLSYDSSGYDQYGYHRLHNIAIRGDIENARKELVQGTDVDVFKIAPSDITHGATPLRSAAQSDQPAMVKFLVENKASVNAADQFGGTPLFSACSNPNVDIVRYLIDHKASVNVQVTNFIGSKLTPLLTASHVSELVQLLIDSGADLGAQDEQGLTALEMAMQYRVTFDRFGHRSVEILRKAIKFETTL